MSQIANVEQLRAGNAPSNIEASFFNTQGFALIQRVANLFANSTMVPEAYRTFTKDKKTGQMVENPAALSNCVVALNMANRIGADPLMVMQNLYVVEGRPAWSSQFIISAINASGKFSPLRFEIKDLGEKDVEYTVSDWKTVDGRRQKVDSVRKARIHDWSCVAWAKERATGERLDSPTITISMAVAEGWYGKNGSKWQTMPEMMLRYRAASFFGRLYAPELLMGIQTVEEAHEVIDVETVDAPESESAPATTVAAIEQKATRSRKKSKGLPDEDRTHSEDNTAPDPEAILEELVQQAPDIEEQPAAQEQIPCPADQNEPVYVSYCQNSCRHYAERTCPQWDFGQA